MADLQSLISMGFSVERAEEALSQTNNAGFELALEFLMITDGIGADKTDKEEGDSRRQFESGAQLPDSHPEKTVLREVTCDTQTAELNTDRSTSIRVRLLNGKTLTKTFNARDELNAVRLWIQSHHPTEQFGLMTNHPRKVFADDDYKQSLDKLNLVPSAVVIVTQPDKWSGMKEYRSTTNSDENRKIEEKRRKEEIEKRCKEMEEERSALERVRAQIEGDKAARRQRWPSLYMNPDDPPSGNQLPQNQPSRALLPRNDRNGNKKTD